MEGIGILIRILMFLMPFRNQKLESQVILGQLLDVGICRMFPRDPVGHTFISGIWPGTVWLLNLLQGLYIEWSTVLSSVALLERSYERKLKSVIREVLFGSLEDQDLRLFFDIF